MVREREEAYRMVREREEITLEIDLNFPIVMLILASKNILCHLNSR